MTKILLYINEYCSVLDTLCTIYANNLLLDGTFVLDYWFGINLRDLTNQKHGNLFAVKAMDIYGKTYFKLNE